MKEQVRRVIKGGTSRRGPLVEVGGRPLVEKLEGSVDQGFVGVRWSEDWRGLLVEGRGEFSLFIIICNNDAT